MQAKFRPAIQCREHRQIDHAASLATETWTRPDHAPRDLGRHLLECGVEIVSPADRPIHVVCTEHVAAYFETLLEQVALVFRTIGNVGHRVYPPMTLGTVGIAHRRCNPVAMPAMI